MKLLDIVADLCNDIESYPKEYEESEYYRACVEMVNCYYLLEGREAADALIRSYVSFKNAAAKAGFNIDGEKK